MGPAECGVIEPNIGPAIPIETSGQTRSIITATEI